MRKISLFFVLLVSLFVISPKIISASEGIIELESLTNRPYRCHATSGLMDAKTFNVLVMCRNLIYPNVDNLDAQEYILWATPIGGGKVIKLGALGHGRKLFKVTKPFDSLFVTTEETTRTILANGTRVMSGNLKEIKFIEDVAPVVEDPNANTLITEAPVDNTVDVEVAEADEANPKTSVSTILRRVGLVASVIFLIALVVFVAILAKSRR